MDVETKEMKVGMDKPINNVVYGASLLSILVSWLFMRRNPVLAVFTGLWVPSILSLGIFMKENKLLEMEKYHHEPGRMVA